MQKVAGMTQQLSGFKRCLQIGSSSCEAELEELMHQIDIMVNNKKVEWEMQVKLLEQRLDAQNQELAKARISFDQKNCEVGILCQKLEEADKAQCVVSQDYEKQLQMLKYQLCKLRKSYEKLSFYQRTKAGDDRTEISPEHEKSQFELRCLTQKLEKQSQSYQEQLSSRSQLQDEAITNNQSEIRRLRCQLDTSQETIRSDGVIIENLKSTVKEITLSRNALKDENQQLLQELKKCQKQCQSMDILQGSEAKLELQARDDLLRAVELEQRQMQKEITSMKQCTNLKENVPGLEELNSHKNDNTLIEEQTEKRFKLSKSKQDQIKNDLQQKASQNTGPERLTTDICDLTAKLHQKNITIATIGGKVSYLERELEAKEHGTSKEQVSDMKNEVLQIENKHLKELLDHLETSRSMAIKSLKEQQKCYDTSIVKLQSENESLQTELIKLRAEQGGLEQHPEKIEAALRLSDTNGTHKRGENDRSFSQESNQKMQNQTNDTSNNQTLYNEWEFDAYDSGRDTPSESLDCLEAGSPLMQSDYSYRQNGNTPPEIDYPDITLIFTHDQQDGPNTPSFMSAAEKFLHEENKRTTDFVKILNSHIDEMQKHSEKTLAKYNNRDHNSHTVYESSISLLQQNLN
ncbi:deuterosome assembly protein 1 isoform X3 [Ascaphus truei]|uniref:deuterosome assembly protein 1 isoform X3 n=1 Tax=Ascaphus truei TaxID=8439 RepID=UPI003F5AC1C7